MLKTNKLAILLLTFFITQPIIHLAAQQRPSSPLFCAGLESSKTLIYSQYQWSKATTINKYPNKRNTTASPLASTYRQPQNSSNNHLYTTHYVLKHFTKNMHMNTMQNTENKSANSCQKNSGITFGLQLVLKRSDTSILQAITLDKKEYQLL